MPCPASSPSSRSAIDAGTLSPCECPCNSIFSNPVMMRSLAKLYRVVLVVKHFAFPWLEKALRHGFCDKSISTSAIKACNCLPPLGESKICLVVAAPPRVCKTQQSSILSTLGVQLTPLNFKPCKLLQGRMSAKQPLHPRESRQSAICTLHFFGSRCAPGSCCGCEMFLGSLSQV